MEVRSCRLGLRLYIRLLWFFGGHPALGSSRLPVRYKTELADHYWAHLWEVYLRCPPRADRVTVVNNFWSCHRQLLSAHNFFISYRVISYGGRSYEAYSVRRKSSLEGRSLLSGCQSVKNARLGAGQWASEARSSPQRRNTSAAEAEHCSWRCISRLLSIHSVRTSCARRCDNLLVKVVTRRRRNKLIASLLQTQTPDYYCVLFRRLGQISALDKHAVRPTTIYTFYSWVHFTHELIFC